MLQQIDFQVPRSETRRIRMLRKSKQVIRGAKHIKQRASPALIVDSLEVVQDLPQFLRSGYILGLFLQSRLLGSELLRCQLLRHGNTALARTSAV